MPRPQSIAAPAPGASAKGEAGVQVILSLILLLGLLIRVAGFHKYIFQDEVQILQNFREFYTHRTFLPSHFFYPTFFSYLSLVPFAAEALVLRLFHVIPTLSGMEVLYQMQSILSVLPLRLTSTCFGMLTVYVTYLTGRRFYDVRTGLIAAAALAFSGIHADYSSWGLPDVTVGFFTMGALYFAMEARESGSLRHYILSGACAGLATSTKYNGALSVLPILCVHVLELYEGRKLGSPRAWISRNLFFSGLATVVAFLAGSPGWLFLPHSFIEGYIQSSDLVAHGHLGASGRLYLTILRFWWQWDTTIAVLCALGAIYAIVRFQRRDLPALAVSLVSFGYIGSWRNQSPHYLIFIFPALCLLGARMVAEGTRSLFKSRSLPAMAGVALLFLAWPMYNDVAWAIRQTGEDGRWAAQQWVQANVPEGSTIIIDVANYVPLLITPEKKEEFLSGSNRQFYREKLEGVPTYRVIDMHDDPAWLKHVKADYLIISTASYERYFVTTPPEPGEPLYEVFMDRKEIYSVLLNKSGNIGWDLKAAISGSAGPKILIFQRNRGIKKHDLRGDFSGSGPSGRQ